MGNNIATIIAGHNLNQKYTFENHDVFNDEPEFVDGLFALNGLDTHHVGSVYDILQLHGPAYHRRWCLCQRQCGLALCCDEIQMHDVKVAAVVAPMLDFSELDLQGMCIMEPLLINRLTKSLQGPADLMTHIVKDSYLHMAQLC